MKKILSLAPPNALILRNSIGLGTLQGQLILPSVACGEHYSHQDFFLYFFLYFYYDRERAISFIYRWLCCDTNTLKIKKKKIKGLSGPYLPQGKMICVSPVTNLLFKDLILLRARIHPGGNHASGHYSPSAGFLNMGLLIKGVGAASWFSMSHQTWQTGL